MTWRGLVIIDLPLEEEIVAAELAAKVNLDFDEVFIITMSRGWVLRSSPSTGISIKRI